MDDDVVQIDQYLFVGFFVFGGKYFVIGFFDFFLDIVGECFDLMV